MHFNPTLHRIRIDLDSPNVLTSFVLRFYCFCRSGFTSSCVCVLKSMFVCSRRRLKWWHSIKWSKNLSRHCVREVKVWKRLAKMYFISPHITPIQCELEKKMVAIGMDSKILFRAAEMSRTDWKWSKHRLKIIIISEEKVLLWIKCAKFVGYLYCVSYVFSFSHAQSIKYVSVLEIRSVLAARCRTSSYFLMTFRISTHFTLVSISSILYVVYVRVSVTCHYDSVHYSYSVNEFNFFEYAHRTYKFVHNQTINNLHFEWKIFIF